MTIFKDIGKGFNHVGHAISKPVNNIGKGVKDAGGWVVGAGESIFKEGKSDVGALFNWTGQQVDKVTGIFNNNTIWIIVGIGLAVFLLKK